MLNVRFWTGGCFESSETPNDTVNNLCKQVWRWERHEHEAPNQRVRFRHSGRRACSAPFKDLLPVVLNQTFCQGPSSPARPSCPQLLCTGEKCGNPCGGKSLRVNSRGAERGAEVFLYPWVDQLRQHTTPVENEQRIIRKISIRLKQKPTLGYPKFWLDRPMFGSVALTSLA